MSSSLRNLCKVAILGPLDGVSISMGWKCGITKSQSPAPFSRHCLCDVELSKALLSQSFFKCCASATHTMPRTSQNKGKHRMKIYALVGKYIISPGLLEKAWNSMFHNMEKKPCFWVRMCFLACTKQRLKNIYSKTNEQQQQKTNTKGCQESLNRHLEHPDYVTMGSFLKHLFLGSWLIDFSDGVEQRLVSPEMSSQLLVSKMDSFIAWDK